ncbi:MAG TPA: c-type cytochrome [Fimbriimonadaceae bacterium]|nr:c-type cytochrome [Fimbriimonadaceae bacterium]
MGLKKAKKPDKSAFKMSASFLVLSVVMLVVMGLSIWKDTHPSWIDYQSKYRKEEQKLLGQQIQQLTAWLKSPSYEADYKKSRDLYDKALAKRDEDASSLEQLEADLDELDIQSAQGEETTTSDQGAAPSAGEMSDLEKELAGMGGSDQGGAQTDSGKGKATQGDSSKDGSSGDMSDLEKELAGMGGGESGGSGQSDKGRADKGKGQASSGDDNSSLEGELDKAFPDSSKGQAAQKGQADQSSQPQAEAPKIDQDELVESSQLEVDTTAAQRSLDDAKRNYAEAQHLYERQTLGLPANETLKIKIAKTSFDAAKAKLALAEANLALEGTKGDLKDHAQHLLWAEDVDKLAEARIGDGTDVDALKKSKDDLDKFHDSQEQKLTQLQARMKKSESARPEIEQIVLPRLKTVERCTTCHMGIEDPMFKDAPQPFRTHPGTIIGTHSPDRFACTTCHGGWGQALDLNEAHGGKVGKGTPLMKGDLVQSTCVKCHGDVEQMTGTNVFDRGKTLFENSGCLGCHKVEGRDIVFKSGPALDHVGAKVDHDWLIKWLENPQSHSVEARMPNFGFKEDEAKAIAAYLLTLHDWKPAHQFTYTPLTPAQMDKADKLVVSIGCTGCHVIQGEGSPFGPELTHVASKASPSWLYSWIENPKAYLPNSKMPVFGLDADQIALITNYLIQIETRPRAKLDESPTFDQALVDKGKELIMKRGCAGCHDIGQIQRIAAPDLTEVGAKTVDELEYGNAKNVGRTLFDWIQAKIDDPKQFETATIKAAMPKFGLTKDETHALAVYLISLKPEDLPNEYTPGLFASQSVLTKGRLLVLRKNCQACHMLNGVGHTVGPDLTREGEKVKPKWLFSFLMKPHRIRWWEPARMPNFHLTVEETTTLVEFIMQMSNQTAPYDYVPADQQVYPLAMQGATYFKKLQCESCHPVGGKQSIAGQDTEKIGPDLAEVTSRLKEDWVFRFLKNPQAIDPGTQMPDFHQPDKVYKSLVDFLMSPKKPAP